MDHHLLCGRIYRPTVDRSCFTYTRYQIPEVNKLDVMNLLDMLSNDATVYQNDDTVTSFYNDATPIQTSHCIKSTVYHFPTSFSSLQADLTEAVVQMFSLSLKNRLSFHSQRARISNLLQPSESMLNGQPNDSHANTAACSLMFNLLLTISMHPSLLVDHFIPKGLLLLSTKALLSSQSGKLSLVDKLINMISEKFDTSSPTKDFNLLVVAKSVKELELVEGLVIGKKLLYKNVSTGKSLYEENRGQKDAVRDDITEDEAAHDTIHKRHEKSRSKSDQTHKAEFKLKLITSSHLCLSYSSDVQFDLIISFDGELDISAPSLDILRSKSMNYIVPIIIPIPVFSIEHIMALVPEPEVDLGGLSSETEAKWQLQVLSIFVTNRQKLYEGIQVESLGSYYAKYAEEITDWIMNWQAREPPHSLKSLTDFSKEVQLDASREKLESKLAENHLNKLGKLFSNYDSSSMQITAQMFESKYGNDYATSRKNLAKFVALRKSQVEELIQKGTQEILPRLRERESRRQEEIDHDEDQISEQYRKLRKLNEEVSIADRKFNRVETEHHKLMELFNELTCRRQYLEETLEKDEDHFDKITEEQLSIIKKLQEELDILQREKETLIDESEAAREEYQAKSTEAVKQTNALKESKAKEAKLRRKLEGPGMKLLPSLAQRDEIAALESQMERISKENSFIKHLFSLQYERIIKERSSLLESSAQSGSSSRTNNRISRASTPF